MVSKLGEKEKWYEENLQSRKSRYRKVATSVNTLGSDLSLRLSISSPLFVITTTTVTPVFFTQIRTWVSNEQNSPTRNCYKNPLDCVTELGVGDVVYATR